MKHLSKSIVDYLYKYACYKYNESVWRRKAKKVGPKDSRYAFCVVTANTCAYLANNTINNSITK